ncbi:MAG: WG repeat-containing protein [Ruminococcus sp.]|nr:WG repeat-containing protein [Ruminococcus sp.]
MNSYKLIFPIVMIVAMIGGIFNLMNARKKEVQQINDSLQTARSYVDQKLYDKAIDEYVNVIDLAPTLENYKEFAEFYFSIEKYGSAISLGSDMTTLFPDNKEGYEFCLRGYMARDEYSSAFELYRKYANICKENSEYIETTIDSLKYEYTDVNSYEIIGFFNNGVAPMCKKNLWGYISTSGSVYISPYFNKVTPMVSELAAAIEEGGHPCIINSDGIKVDNIEGVESALDISLVYDDKVAVLTEDGWGYYDVHKGKLIDGFEVASAMIGDKAAVKKGGQWYVVKSDGSIDLNGDFEEIKIDEKGVYTRNDRLFVKEDRKYYMIDGSGKKITEDAYEDCKLFSDDTPAAVKKDGKWGFVDTEGTMVVEPKYEDARSFSNGYAAVKLNGKWGYITLDGYDLCIDYTFADARDFNSAGSTVVSYSGGDWTLIMFYRFL